VDCQRAFKSFLFPREMSVVLFFVSSAIPKWTVEVANFSRPQESYRLKRPYTGGWKPGGWTVNPVSLHSESFSAKSPESGWFDMIIIWTFISFGHCYYDDSIFQCLAEWNHLAGKLISGRGTDSVFMCYNMAAVKRANRETAVRSVSDKPLDWKFSDQVDDAQLQRGLHVLANNSQSVIEYFTRQ
jgi:hypothetical protein